jgi:hypothetical protein
MALKNYLTVLSVLPLLLLTSGCFSWNKTKELKVSTIEVQRKIPVQPRPRPVDMNDIKFYVVTEENFNKFKNKFKKDVGSFLFYAISVRDYETLALNMSEIKRYIEQQKQIIIYYESAIKHEKKK